MNHLSPSNSSEASDIEVLDQLMVCNAKAPVVSYKQLYLENGTPNNLVGGKIDYLVGLLITHAEGARTSLQCFLKKPK